MKRWLTILVLLGSALAQTTKPNTVRVDGVQVELRANTTRVAMKDNLSLTVFFRSSEKGEVTLWNALDWGSPAGLYLDVVDSSGRNVPNDFAPFFHPLPPNQNGKGALISILRGSFAGFDSEIPVRSLFPRPGVYRLKCRYNPPLSRYYFKGYTIWGKEDGSVESTPVLVTVEP